MFGQVDDLVSLLRAQDLGELPDAHIEEDFATLQRYGDRLEAERLRRLGEIERRRVHERDGHLSAVSWLANVHGVARSSAAADVRTARALEQMPVARAALERGELTVQAVRALGAARGFDVEAFARSEELLVDAARKHTPDDLRRVLGHWRHRVQQARLGEDGLRDSRGLHASVTFEGMVRIDGNLDPETGESLLAAIGSIVDADARSGDEDDRRTPAQRRADALGEVCRGWLDRADRPAVAGDRPHVAVTIDLHDLASFGSGEFERTGPISSAAVRRLACDASVLRVMMASPSQPLDVGRRTAVVPPAIRRALIVRDGGCRFPGCDRPHSWCDAHHVQHWAEGGATALTNLILLCRRHHRSIHEGFGVRMVSGGPVFSRPDGTPLADRAPPARAA
jgi:hypothetical protein